MCPTERRILPCSHESCRTLGRKRNQVVSTDLRHTLLNTGSLRWFVSRRLLHDHTLWKMMALVFVLLEDHSRDFSGNFFAQMRRLTVLRVIPMKRRATQHETFTAFVKCLDDARTQRRRFSEWAVEANTDETRSGR